MDGWEGRKEGKKGRRKDAKAWVCHYLYRILRC